MGTGCCYLEYRTRFRVVLCNLTSAALPEFDRIEADVQP